MSCLLSCPTNFSTELLDGYSDLNESGGKGRIFEVHGAIDSEFGGGWPIPGFPKADIATLKHHVEEAKARGMDFNYVLDVPCVGQKEHEPQYPGRLRDFVVSIHSVGVNTVTVTMPFLIGILRQHVPDMAVTTSASLCHIAPIEEINQLQELGVERVTLWQDICRDFPLIRQVRESTSAKLVVLVNTFCRLNCLLRPYHLYQAGHMSISRAPSGTLKYIQARCFLERMSDPTELVKSPWIRPEDCEHYSKVGVDIFQIGTRTYNTTTLLDLARAYVSGHFDGDWFRLLTSAWFPEEVPGLGMSIDNRELDGFIDHFLNTDNLCSRGCGSCSYCRQVAARVVEVDETKLLPRIQEAESLLRSSLGMARS